MAGRRTAAAPGSHAVNHAVGRDSTIARVSRGVIVEGRARHRTAFDSDPVIPISRRAHPALLGSVWRHPCSSKVLISSESRVGLHTTVGSRPAVLAYVTSSVLSSGRRCCYISNTSGCHCAVRTAAMKRLVGHLPSLGTLRQLDSPGRPSLAPKKAKKPDV